MLSNVGHSGLVAPLSPVYHPQTKKHRSQMTQNKRVLNILEVSRSELSCVSASQSIWGGARAPDPTKFCYAGDDNRELRTQMGFFRA